jgi:small basic protein
VPGSPVVAAENSRRIGNPTLIRLTAYYLLAGAGLYGLRRLVALLPPAMGSGQGPFPGWADAALQMISALVLALPMAFVYVRTRTRDKYDHSLVQTVIVLPITVAAVLIVVQNSLALAFSLAGVVAAIRFRNNLKESRDAVYIFGSLGIGFATGVHQPEIAIALSVLFCAVELALWKLDIGADHEATFCKLCGHASLPHEHVAIAPPGDPAATAETGVSRDFRIRVFVTDPGPGRRAVEPALEELVKRWEFLASGEGGGRRYLDYQVHLKKRGSVDELGDALRTRGAGQVEGLDTRPAPAEPAVTA